MDFKDCIINQFIKSKFDKDYSEIPAEEAEDIYTKYIDISGLFDSEEFNKVSYIHYLNGRINTIKLSIRLQREFLEEFGVPFSPEFKIFKKFGHIVFWKDDKEKFLEVLERIELRESRFEDELKSEIKKLKAARAIKVKSKSVELTREGFLTTIISLGKLGYKIDRHKTTMEEMALMIRNQMEENKR